MTLTCSNRPARALNLGKEWTSVTDLGVDPGLVNSLKEMGITEPFEVQRESIPDAMMGNDVCCRAPTGSGKTLAFGLPLIMRTIRADPEFPTSLVLSPTRELAEQIAKVLAPLASTFDLEVLSVYGGVPYGRQRKVLSRGVDIVVACPGRLLDLLDHGALSLEDVGTVVLDEADRMADMGSWNLFAIYWIDAHPTVKPFYSVQPSTTKFPNL